MKRIIALGLAAVGLTSVQAQQAQVQSVVVGVLTVTVTVVLATPIPQGGFGGCSADVNTIDNTLSAGLSTLNNEGDVVLGVVSGGIATCTMTIPYYWSLVTPAADIMQVTYGAAILPAGATLVQGTISGAPPIRHGNHTFAPITGVPVTGTHWALKATTKL